MKKEGGAYGPLDYIQIVCIQKCCHIEKILLRLVSHSVKDESFTLGERRLKGEIYEKKVQISGISVKNRKQIKQNYSVNTVVPWYTVKWNGCIFCKNIVNAFIVK